MNIHFLYITIFETGIMVCYTTKFIDMIEAYILGVMY